MTIKTSKNIRICCFVALAFCLVWAVSMVANFIVNVFGNAASSHPIDWSQNTFLKVWNNLNTFRGESKLTTWLHRIAINEALDFALLLKHR